MGKSKGSGFLAVIYRKIKTYPGRTVWFIARLVGLKEEDLPEALRALEQEGFHVRKDDEERLWVDEEQE